MPIHQVEFNMIITALGMMCAMVQGLTGAYAGFYRKRVALLRTDDILNRAHRAFGGFATTLYLLGLFAGINGIIGAFTRNEPPLELSNASFNIHTWGSFVVLAIFIWKTYHSYFDKKPLFGRKKWLGQAMFAAWAFNWITAAVSYYVRTQPGNLQHPAPVFLLPYSLMGLQIALPFILGGLIGWLIIRQSATEREARQEQS